MLAPVFWNLTVLYADTPPQYAIDLGGGGGACLKPINAVDLLAGISCAPFP